jgi:hypothetical protein
MQLRATVLVIDLSIFSIGAIHSELPVSFRSRIAFLRRSTGWYVSGTKSMIRQSWQLASVYDAQPSQLLLTCTPDHIMTSNQRTKSVYVSHAVRIGRHVRT